MQKFNRQQLEEIFEMYKTNAIYLTEAEIKFPELKASLIFPKMPIYLNENLKIKHINNTEVEMIINQGIFLFYRQVFLDGYLDFPKIPENKLRDYYNEMFIKKKIDYYERFTSRNKKDLILLLEHKNTRKIGNTQFVWCDLEIPEFMHAWVIGGIQFEK